MFISGIELNKHPLIEDCQIDFSMPNLEKGEIGLNYIVGASGTGKTYFLEAIFPTLRDSQNQHLRINQREYEYELKLKDEGGHIVCSINQGMVKCVDFNIPSPIVGTPVMYLTEKTEQLSRGKRGVKVNTSKTRQGEDYLKDASNSGSGERRMESILGQITDDALKGFSIVVIEEPDCHLDPEHQVSLLKRIIEISKSKQVFITTHSPYLIDWNTLENGGTVLKLSRSKREIVSETVVGVFNDKSLVKDIINKQQKTQPHLSGVETKNIFFSNSVLLVEGQDDVGCISNYLNSEGIDYSFTFYGYGVGGSSKFDRLLELCTSLKIPKIGVLFDSNPASSDAEYKQLKEKYKSFSTVSIEKIAAEDIRDKNEHEINKEGICELKIKTGAFSEKGKWKGDSDEFGKDFKLVINNLINHFNS